MKYTGEERRRFALNHLRDAIASLELVIDVTGDICFKGAEQIDLFTIEFQLNKFRDAIILEENLIKFSIIAAHDSFLHERLLKGFFLWNQKK